MNEYSTKYMEVQEDTLQKVINKEMTVVAGAERLGISRPTLYERLKRYERYGIAGLLRKQGKKRGPAHNRTPEDIEVIVTALAEKWYMEGVEALSDRLEREHGISLHPTTIWRILKRKNSRYTDQWKRTTKRWKIKLYAHDTPGQELQMDTCYPYGYKQGWVIYTIIDDASRFAFAYLYKRRANAEDTLDFLRRYMDIAPFPIQKIRTDQGREFTATEVRNFLKELHIEHRLNTPYCPEENGKIERFHRTLKEQCIRPHISPSLPFETAQYRLTLFLNHYNREKKHRGLGMHGLTPIQKLVYCASVKNSLQCYNI